MHLCRNYAYRWVKNKRTKKNIFWLTFKIIRCFKVVLNIMLKISPKKYTYPSTKKIWPKEIDKNNYPLKILPSRLERMHFQNNEKGIMTFTVKN